MDLSFLRGTRVVAILRASATEHVVAAARTLHSSGVPVLEVTLTTPGALDALAAVRRALPADAVVGAGTVRTVEDVRACARAGAAFLVTPGCPVDVVRCAVDEGLPILAGALTPTEIDAVATAGASAVKVFPAAALGGPSYVRHLRGPFPDVPLVPTGGVGLDAVRTYLDAGAAAVALGGPLRGDALEGGALGALRERARTAVAGVAAAGGA